MHGIFGRGSSSRGELGAGVGGPDSLVRLQYSCQHDPKYSLMGNFGVIDIVRAVSEALRGGEVEIKNDAPLWDQALKVPGHQDSVRVV